MDDSDCIVAVATPKPTRKRKRTAHACEPCRQRKSRCDGSRPSCDLCMELELQCFYRDATKKNMHGPDRQSFARLETRLSDMETILQTLAQGNRNRSTISPSQKSRHNAEIESVSRSHDGHSDSNLLPDLSPPETIPSIDPAAPSVMSYDSVDGMASITFSDDRTSGFFGPTSNSAFLRTIITAQNWVYRQKETESLIVSEFDRAKQNGFSRPASPPIPSVPLSTRFASSQPATVGPDANLYAMPPDHEVSHLIDVYFKNTGKSFPYLYKPWIVKIATEIRQFGPQRVERAELCVLNLVMAFAVTYCPSPKPISTKTEHGDVFLQRALGLISHIKTTADNLESIQALLMATQFIQGTQRSSHTWSVFSALVQFSFQIGLYQPSTYSGLSPLKAEVHKRTWWMCFTMDKMCSMTYGRPPLIPNCYMKADLPTETELEMLDEHDTGSAVEELDSSTSSLFFYTSKLYLLLGSIIENVYQNNIIRRDQPENYHRLLIRVLEAERDLLEFKLQLPPNMRPIEESELHGPHPIVNPQPYRCRIILSLRFFNVRMLLHRIILSKLLETPKTDTNATCQAAFLKMSIGSIDTCVKAAVETISLISKTTQHQDVLPVWWYSTYFTFSSALVVYGTILTTHKHNVKDIRYSSRELVDVLQTASSIFGSIGGELRQVRRCQKVVRHLLQASAAFLPNGQVRMEEGLPREKNTDFMSSNPTFDFTTENLMRDINDDIQLEFSTLPEELNSYLQHSFPI